MVVKSEEMITYSVKCSLGIGIGGMDCVGMGWMWIDARDGGGILGGRGDYQTAGIVDLIVGMKKFHTLCRVPRCRWGNR